MVALLLGAVGVRQYLAPRLGPQACRITVGGDSLTYDLDQSANAATISTVAIRQGLPTRAATIALATAMQESKLRNLAHGDRDSLGLFQQRPSQGWGTPDQLQDPVYASEKFYKGLVKVRDYQTRPLTDVAQAVQRSGYPEAYAKHEDEADVLARAFSGDVPASVTCRVDGRRIATSPQAVAERMKREIGVSPDLGVGEVHGTLRTERGAWATGHWAVAHASALGVETVTVGNRRWTRAKDGTADRWETVLDGGAARQIKVTLQP